MSALKPGWPQAVVKYLLAQSEPVTAKKIAAEALGIDSSLITKGEFVVFSRVIFDVGWRSQKFWLPPAHDGPWNEESAA
jgi:hypothetical protein